MILKSHVDVVTLVSVASQILGKAMWREGRNIVSSRGVQTSFIRAESITDKHLTLGLGFFWQSGEDNRHSVCAGKHVLPSSPALSAPQPRVGSCKGPLQPLTECMVTKGRSAEFGAASSSGSHVNWPQTAQAAAWMRVRAAKAQQPIPCPAMLDCGDLSESLEFESLL